MVKKKLHENTCGIVLCVRQSDFNDSTPLVWHEKRGKKPRSKIDFLPRISYASKKTPARGHTPRWFTLVFLKFPEAGAEGTYLCQIRARHDCPESCDWKRIDEIFFKSRRMGPIEGRNLVFFRFAFFLSSSCSLPLYLSIFISPLFLLWHVRAYRNITF